MHGSHSRFITGGVLAALALVAAPIFAAEPDAGATLYRRYCAACHGIEGRGDGPAAGALVPPPTDLTRPGRDERELMTAIDGRRSIRAHGNSEMPIWGEVFEQSLIDVPHARRAALHTVQTIARYVLSLGMRPRDAAMPSMPER